jgi:predicted anti-sigma-YlaC factor YlaD
MTSKAQMEKEQATEQADLTPDETLAALLAEVQRCRHKLGAIAGWIAFMGLVLLLSIVLTMCNAALSL